jgi:aldehyde:ferredoxin oxidoreductase
MTNKGVAITSYEPRGSMTDAIGLVMNPVGELHGGRGYPERIAFDSLTTCSFLRRDIPIVFGSLDNWVRPMLEGAAGWKLSEEDWKSLVMRATLMERCISIREGYVPSRDDVLPDRFFTETIFNKYGEPKILSRERFFEMRKKAYLSFGLNEEGVPSKKTLESLGMEFVIPALEKKLGAWE